MRRIVENRQYEEYKGIAIDMQTANAVITVYDLLNKKNKKKLGKHNLFTIVNVCWKIIKRSK